MRVSYRNYKKWTVVMVNKTWSWMTTNRYMVCLLDHKANLKVKVQMVKLHKMSKIEKTEITTQITIIIMMTKEIENKTRRRNKKLWMWLTRLMARSQNYSTCAIRKYSISQAVKALKYCMISNKDLPLRRSYLPQLRIKLKPKVSERSNAEKL